MMQTIDELAALAREQGWNEGFDQGLEAGREIEREHWWGQGFDEAFAAGRVAEREAVIFALHRRFWTAYEMWQAGKIDRDPALHDQRRSYDLAHDIRHDLHIFTLDVEEEAS